MMQGFPNRTLPVTGGTSGCLEVAFARCAMRGAVERTPQRPGGRLEVGADVAPDNAAHVRQYLGAFGPQGAGFVSWNFIGSVQQDFRPFHLDTHISGPIDGTHFSLPRLPGDDGAARYGVVTPQSVAEAFASAVMFL